MPSVAIEMEQLRKLLAEQLPTLNLDQLRRVLKFVASIDAAKIDSSLPPKS